MGIAIRAATINFVAGIASSSSYSTLLYSARGTTLLLRGFLLRRAGIDRIFPCVIEPSAEHVGPLGERPAHVRHVRNAARNLQAARPPAPLSVDNPGEGLTGYGVAGDRNERHMARVRSKYAGTAACRRARL